MDSESLRQLLATQLEALEQALTCNRAVADRLDGIRQLKVDLTPRPDQQDGSAQVGRLILSQAIRDPASINESLQTASSHGITSPRLTQSTPRQTPRQTPPPAPVKVTSGFEPGQSPLSQPLLDIDRHEPPRAHHMANGASEPGSPLTSHPVLPFKRSKHAFAQRKVVMQTTRGLPRKTLYNVEDLYHEDGCWQALARNICFQNMTLVIIVLNTLWMAIDTDYNKADVLCNAPLVFQIADNFFCGYFFFEILVRFMAFRRKCDTFGDFWLVFDSSLVLLMVWETWIQVIIFLWSHGSDDGFGGARSASILRLFRVFRLLRISRMTRLLRHMPELLILVKSIGTAMRCMFVTLCMLLLIIYMFAIMFTQLLSGTETAAGAFDTVPEAMNFMLMQVLCGFDAKFVDKLLAAGVLYYVLWLFYVLIGSLSIMNILIGILCEVVSGTADVEKENAVKKDMEYQISLLDTDDQVVSRQAMIKILENSTIIEKLHELQIDPGALMDFVNYAYADDHVGMPITDFVDMVVQFRGPKGATVKDIVDLRKFVSTEVTILEAQLLGHRGPH